jgi:hypothetical protein
MGTETLDQSRPGAYLRNVAASPFEAQEREIRRYYDAERDYDPMTDDFGRLAALAMLAEIDRLKGALNGR